MQHAWRPGYNAIVLIQHGAKFTFPKKGQGDLVLYCRKKYTHGDPRWFLWRYVKWMWSFLLSRTAAKSVTWRRWSSVFKRSAYCINTSRMVYNTFQHFLLQVCCHWAHEQLDWPQFIKGKKFRQYKVKVIFPGFHLGGLLELNIFSWRMGALRPVSPFLLDKWEVRGKSSIEFLRGGGVNFDSMTAVEIQTTRFWKLDSLFRQDV